MKALFAEKPEIPKKFKPAPEASKLENKTIGSNGLTSEPPPSNSMLKRPLDDETEPNGANLKKRRLGDAESKNDGVLVLDDDGDSGAILIDDD